MTIYITATGKNDGVGSQTLSKILAMIYARHNNYTYVHSPYQIIDVREQDKFGLQAQNNGKMKDWVRKWEEFFDLGYQEMDINQLKINGKIDLIIDLTDVLKTGQITMKDHYLWHNFNPTSIIKQSISTNPNKNILFLIKEFPKIDTYPDSLVRGVINDLHKKYQIYKKPDLLYFKTLENKDQEIINNLTNDLKNELNIVIHKRHTRIGKYVPGMDLNAKNCRITLNTFYLNIIEKINETFNNQKKNNLNKYRNINFIIFTDGNKDYFPELNFNNSENIVKYKTSTIRIMMRTNSMETLHYFTNADILIMDKSSFSFIGAIYNKNKIITNPYWDKSLSNWIDINNIDYDKLLN